MKKRRPCSLRRLFFCLPQLLNLESFLCFAIGVRMVEKDRNLCKSGGTIAGTTTAGVVRDSLGVQQGYLPPLAQVRLPWSVEVQSHILHRTRAFRTQNPTFAVR